MSKKKKYTFTTIENIPISLSYYLFFPDRYDNINTEFPLVLYLHGAGERGNDLADIEINGLPDIVKTSNNLPFVVVAPQCPILGYWSQEEYVSALSGLLKSVIKDHRINEQKVYATGLSMGGYGTLALARQEPNMFAAIIPICGGMENLENIEIFKDLPIWLFHGDNDKVISAEKSITIYKLLKSINSNIKLTIYEGVGHNSWDQTYSNPEIYRWMFQFKKKLER